MVSKYSNRTLNRTGRLIGDFPRAWTMYILAANPSYWIIFYSKWFFSFQNIYYDHDFPYLISCILSICPHSQLHVFFSNSLLNKCEHM